VAFFAVTLFSQKFASASFSIAFPAGDFAVPGGYAAGNRGADYVKCLAPALAPEQGT